MSSVPSLADIEKIAELSIPVIERDSAQKMNERMRKVVKHWLVRAMVDVRTATLAHQKAEVAALLSRITDQMTLVSK
jgi:hypothetical protein